MKLEKPFNPDLLYNHIVHYYIDKKGWGFNNDNLTKGELESMINKGAEYLYSDSRKIDNNPEIVHLLDKLILEKGTIKVYSLKTNKKQ